MAKKNNTAEKALINAEEISNALKESTKKTLMGIINEAIGGCLKEDDDVDVDDTQKDVTTDTPIDDSDDYEEQDVETKVTSTDTAEDDAEGDGEKAADDSDSAEGEEWADMEDFKVGDNDYDFTGVNGETALKVYNSLGDDDQICIKKEEDGTFTMTDQDTGAEYTIELDSDEVQDDDAVDDDDSELDAVDDADVEGDVDFDEVEDDSDEDDPSFEIDLSDEEPVNDEADDKEDKDEVELELNEDLGYTDNYQDKDPIEGLNNKEVAPNGAKDWNDGVPTDAKKPWAGKGDSDPFEKKVNECGATMEGEEQPIEEGADSVSQQAVRKQTKTKVGQHRPNNSYEVTKEDSPLNEKITAIVNKAKEIQAENKQYKEANKLYEAQLKEFKKALYEAAVLNVKYGKAINLLVNETMTKEEKAHILERFDKVNTIKESQALFETIQRELSETKKSAPIIERTISAESSKNINETPIYSPKNNPSIQLMERMDNLYSKKKTSVLNESKGKMSDSLDLMLRMEKMH